MCVKFSRNDLQLSKTHVKVYLLCILETIKAVLMMAEGCYFMAFRHVKPLRFHMSVIQLQTLCIHTHTVFEGAMGHSYLVGNGRRRNPDLSLR